MSSNKEFTFEELAQHQTDVRAIQNIAAKYQYWHHADMHDEVFDLYAKKLPDIKAQISNWGIYVGQEGVARLMLGVQKWLERGDRTGRTHTNTLVNPIIEVAGDGKTAKGLWCCTGANTSPNRAEGTFQAQWSYSRFAADFVREDGEWKLWHTLVTGVFQTKFEEAWVFAPDHVKFDFPEELKPNIEGGYHWQYNTSICTKAIPAPPEPYWTFAETFSYL